MVNAWNKVKCKVISVSDMLECTPQPWIWMTMTCLPGEELQDLEALVQKMSKEHIDAAPYAAFNDGSEAYYSLDSADPEWRETLQGEVIATHSNSN